MTDWFWMLVAMLPFAILVFGVFWLASWASHRNDPPPKPSSKLFIWATESAPNQIRAAKIDPDIPDTINAKLALQIVQKAAIVFGGDSRLHRRYGELALFECVCYLTFLVYRTLTLADGQRVADYIGKALSLSVRDVFVHNSGTNLSSWDIKAIWEVRSRIYRAIKREETDAEGYKTACLLTLATFIYQTTRDGVPCPVVGSEPIGLTLPKIPRAEIDDDFRRMLFALDAWHEEIVDGFLLKLGFVQNVPADFYANPASSPPADLPGHPK